MPSPQRRHTAAGFTCIHCRRDVDARSFGTRHRNHCPVCLWSRHVDDTPGDRRCAYRAPMRPVGVETRDDGEWSIIHRCTGCGALKANRIAGDDRELALLQLALLQLVLRPLSNPPFPLDHLPV